MHPPLTSAGDPVHYPVPFMLKLGLNSGSVDGQYVGSLMFQCAGFKTSG